ncbi:MAG: outer membrane protein heavy metal efflux system [Acidobacteriota bacterium]|jgi:outer membrane protein TolC|nr:outer membrane protein heavy metal efflux system [Acidobacteriota bacterium]
MKCRQRHAKDAPAICRLDQLEPAAVMLVGVMRKSGMILLLLGACVPYRPQPVSVQENARVLTARALTGTPSRDDVLRAALELHPGLAVARADLAAAQAAIRQAAERPNPVASAGLERLSGAGDGSPWVTSLSLDLPFETAGKRGARVRQAEAMSAEAAANVDQAIWNVRSGAGRAWTEVVRRVALTALRQREAELREDVVAIYAKRLQVGEAATSDVARARAEARMARAAVFAEEARLASARDSLAAAIGIPRSALPEQLADSQVPVVHMDERLQELALTARPDVLAALAHYQAADAALRLEVKNQYPDVHLSPGLGWDQGAFKWTIGAAAELPLFNRHEGAIARAEAERDRAGAQLLAVQANVLAALDAARTRERTAQERLAAAERVVESRDALLASARRAFAVGEIDRLELRLAELESAAAAADREDARFDVAAAAVELEAAVEQPLGGSR